MPTVRDGLRSVITRLRTMGRRDALTSQLDEEMRFHQELLARDLEAGGLSPADAEQAARRRFGNPVVLRERSADTWGFPALEQLWQDIRYGARVLRQSPGFSAIAIGAIGLAIGINAGFFTLVDTFLWQPIPVAHPERLVKLLIDDARGSQSIRFSYPELTTLATTSRTIDDVVAYIAQPVAVKATAATPAAAGIAGCVSSNYFAALGGSTIVGRSLASFDDRDDTRPAVVLSDGFWARAFQRAPDAVGRDIVINGSHATVVGVARPEFIGINPLIPDFWITLPHAERVGATPGRLRDRSNRFIMLYARLRPGISMRSAEGELSGLIAQPPAPVGSTEQLTRITGVSLLPNSSIVPPNSETALMLAPALLVVALVLVIACANLANLLLSRALVRQREIAVRLALGASRGRLMRQLLTESLLIAVAGAGLGYLLGDWTVRLVSRSFFAAVPITFGRLALSLHPSWRVVAYTVALACVSVLTFGLAPALQATTPNLTSALKGEEAMLGTTVRRSRVRDWLVAVQVAASVVLLVAAGTLAQGVRAFAKDSSWWGLDPTGVVVASFGLAPSGHISSTLAAERATFAARVAAAPGVAVTARVLEPPFSSWPILRLAPAGVHEQLRAFLYNRVTPRYFDIVGQRVVEGRGFTADDSANAAPVVILSQAAARRLWATRGGSVVGRSIRIAAGADSSDRIVQVAGVVADAHSNTIWDEGGGDAGGYVYLPASRADFSTFDMPLLARTASRSAGSTASVDRALGDIAAAVDPNAPLHIDALPALRDLEALPLRYGAAITLAVGALGLALALIGLYGVVAFAVRQRRRDIAVHVAMGARAHHVLRLVLRRELRLIASGLVFGLVLAIGEAGLIQNLTLPLAPLGLGGFGVIVVLLLAVATTATVAPAIGALRVAPMGVLRQE